MKAIWRGQVIAESDRTLEVHGYRYFPREAVRMDLLQLAPKTTSDLACPHGVQFYDLAADAARSERAGGLCHTWPLVGRRRQAHKRAATKSDGRRAAGIACAPSC